MNTNNDEQIWLDKLITLRQQYGSYNELMEFVFNNDDRFKRHTQLFNSNADYKNYV